MKPLIDPSRLSPGPRTDDARLRRMDLQIAALMERVDALEAKRGPGRPPKPKAENGHHVE